MPTSKSRHSQSKQQNAEHNRAEPERAFQLGRAIRNLLKCDEAETVQEIARYVISKYDSLRIGAAYMERNRETSVPRIAAFLGAVTRFLEIRTSDENRNGIAWAARLDNERRAIEKLMPMLPDVNWTEFTFHRRPNRTVVLKLRRKLFPLRRRIMSLARGLIGRGHKYFKVLRAAELIGYYAHYLDIFQNGDFRAAIYSSHSNPHGIAFQAAARRCRIPTVLVTHGMPVRPVAQLECDLAVVHCEAARQIYIEAGCRMKKVLIHGRRQDYAPMPEFLPKQLSVGVFLCKDVNEDCLQSLIGQLLKNERTARILVRPHPKNLFVGFDDWLESFADERIYKSSGNEVLQDLQESDIVLGGNSSVLIEAVTAGIPAGYVPNLDYGSPDLHEFIRYKLIYPNGNDLNFEFDQMLKFYQRTDWQSVLQYFADIENDENSAANQFAEALRNLLIKS